MLRCVIEGFNLSESTAHQKLCVGMGYMTELFIEPMASSIMLHYESAHPMKQNWVGILTSQAAIVGIPINSTELIDLN